MVPRGRVALALLLIMGAGVLSAAVVLAQQRRNFGFFSTERSEPSTPNIPYDGRFTFARLRYTTGPGGYYYQGLPAWAHGYPRAEHHLMKIMKELSFLAPHIDESNVFGLNDPDLFKYPVVFITEAGFWVFDDKEVDNLRAYLQKGGFVIVDDSRSDRRGGGGYAHFEMMMRRVMPDGLFIDLDPSHPIFHSFFEINSFEIIPQAYDAARPVLRGLFENNDPKKRLMMMVNFETDVSHFWEFSDSGFAPVEESNEAYKLGVNYLVYGLTH
jgi:hypothetical protein